MKKITLQQVAETAGVSISTVDRVINKRGSVSPKAEIKVLQAAQSLNLDRYLFRSYLHVIRVAVVMHSLHNHFCRVLHEAFHDLNLTMADIRISCFLHYVNVGNLTETRTKLQKIVHEYDALIVIAPNDPALSKIIYLISHKIPVITLATDIPDSGRLAYIGPNNYQLGRIAAELMGRFIGTQKGEILIILGMAEMDGHTEREAGFRSVIQQHFPNCSIVACLESDENQYQAGKMVANALHEFKNIRGIYNVSDGNSLIAKMLKTANLSKKVNIITHELTPAHHELLKQGIIDVIIDQNPKIEAKQALECIADYFHRNKERSHYNYTPFNLFLRESVL
ncbi:LacI family DNA-binding transcriptional regulator [Commensalibacter oyaizuii]|uniref:LacI family DNA-binding transcriptional regulator n=1 Tax=Commensalibacter oyaizuii TaxID=3043873 RepID=A0ABT6Q403_9PROT|nr:LacI family DNA-binding transcriptional regulator [Commensalibacter sp. TBRC 16381]MDI2091838.1 LacI family DNA-binding transcriptional regulator [Commensalibacter sp. TBRC 16381]